MEYTVQKLAIMAGISTRTLRYYDEIGILNRPGLILQGIAYTVRLRLTLQQILLPGAWRKPEKY